MTITAVFEGNDPSDLIRAQAWAGAAFNGVTLFTGQASWADYTGSVGWLEGVWSGTSTTKLWSIPLIANGADLHSAGLGAYDSNYKQVAKTLADAQGSGPIYVRTGWEFNGSWEAWSAQGKADDYIAAFRDFVTAFRSVSDRFVFTWAPSIGDQGMNPAQAYPGDAFVDIVGMDFYYNPAYYSSDAGKAWSSMVSQTYGLQWLEDFAKAHGKPTAYPEWGVETDGAADFIKSAAAWFASHNVIYQGYWDSNADFAGKLSSGAYPDAGKAYLTAFASGAVGVTTPATSAGVTGQVPQAPSDFAHQMANVLRSSLSATDLAEASSMASALASGSTTLAQASSVLSQQAAGTTSVAVLAYQFFTGSTPTAAGLDYLVSPSGGNVNNINSAFYQTFTIENRYINFAVNLGRYGEGAAAFAARFGGETLFETTREAYAAIFGAAPSDAKTHALLDASLTSGGQAMTRAQYFATYGGDGLDGIGTKAAAVGWLLSEAVKEDVGLYAKSNDAYLVNLANGGAVQVDLVGRYGSPAYDVSHDIAGG